MTATEDEIIKLCKENIAGYKKPKSVEFIDNMPLTPVGKVKKNALRKMYQNQ